MANKVPTDGHKSLNVQQSRFLSDVFAKEDKYRSLMIKNGNKRMSKARNPLIQSARSNGRSTKNRQKNTQSKTARTVNSSRSMGMSARSQFTNTARVVCHEQAFGRFLFGEEVDGHSIMIVNHPRP